MRTIKFKYWNTVAKRWEKGAGYAFNEQGFMGSSDILPVQFTGLKDKNGKEIYEGDIVRFHAFVEGGGMQGSIEVDYEGVGEVFYDSINMQFCFTTVNPNRSWEVLDTDHYDVPCIEVIGNIYDNPELI